MMGLLTGAFVALLLAAAAVFPMLLVGVPWHAIDIGLEVFVLALMVGGVLMGLTALAEGPIGLVILLTCVGVGSYTLYAGPLHFAFLVHE